MNESYKLLQHANTQKLLAMCLVMAGRSMNQKQKEKDKSTDPEAIK